MAIKCPMLAVESPVLTVESPVLSMESPGLTGESPKLGVTGSELSMARMWMRKPESAPTERIVSEPGALHGGSHGPGGVVWTR